MQVPELCLGYAGREITPPVGIHMGGYWGRKSGATQVHDALWAKVLVFSCGEEKAALAALDLVGLDAQTVQQLRQRIEGETGIPAPGVMVCCSHTHAGPLTMAFRGMGEMDLGYLERVKEAVAELAAEAVGQRWPARLLYARVPVQIGVNRRQSRQGATVIGQNPEGPVVAYAHLLRFAGREGRGAVLFSHACHPVVLGSANHSLSGDFAGAAVRHFEAQTGQAALFVNGACGDINPRKQGGTFADVEELGKELAQAVAGGLDQAQEVEVRGVSHALEKVPLPLLEPPPRLLLEAEKLALQLKAELGKLAQSGQDQWAQRVPRARLEWAQELLERVRRGQAKDQHQPFEIQGIALGELVLLGMEGEIFARYQLDLEQAGPPTLLCGYANGCIGYVPTADEYRRGGYEVEEAYKVYPSVQMIGPQSEEIIRERATALLARLRGRLNRR
jgi:hypothetical protein